IAFPTIAIKPKLHQADGFSLPRHLAGGHSNIGPCAESPKILQIDRQHQVFPYKDTFYTCDEKINFVPSCSVHTLPNKIDELSALNNQRIYRESSLFIFTETWLNHLVPDANVDLLGFTAVRADRDTEGEREKQRWGTHHVCQQLLV
ncbi:hypothetical protein L3Q82_019365, partial [Scortum barcoo]